LKSQELVKTNPHLP